MDNDEKNGNRLNQTIGDYLDLTYQHADLQISLVKESVIAPYRPLSARYTVEPVQNIPIWKIYYL